MFRSAPAGRGAGLEPRIYRPGREDGTAPPKGTVARMTVASAAIGAVLMPLELATYGLVTTTGSFRPAGGSLGSLLLDWAALAVTFPVTVLAFYFIGKGPGVRDKVGTGLVGIYLGSLGGELAGGSALVLLTRSSPLAGAELLGGLSFSLSLEFVFIAFSGYALSSLSRPGEGTPGMTHRLRLAPCAALIFGLEAGLTSPIALQSISSETMVLTGYLTFANFVLGLPVEFVVFYYIGKRERIRGRTVRAFGYLFAGAYLGIVLGTLVAVAIFGQGSWSVTQGTTYYSNGVLYQNLSPSLQAVLVSLNPIGALPFLPFFAISLPGFAAKRAGAPAIPGASDAERTGGPSWPSPFLAREWELRSGEAEAPADVGSEHERQGGQKEGVAEKGGRLES